MKIQQILASKGMNIITVQPQQPVREAIALLSQHRIGALVVVGDSGQPIGILSERDIIRRAAEHETFFADSVADLMTERLITGTPQDDTFSVAATMTERRFRHLPIMDEGQLIGIVSIGDILKAERNQYRGEIDTLETRIMAGEA